MIIPLVFEYDIFIIAPNCAQLSFVLLNIFV